MAASRPCIGIAPARSGTARGFSLIELLVVISIISILLSMALPLVSMARRRADHANTQSLLRRVATAANLFRTEAGGLPYQAWSTAANPPPAAETVLPGNRLAHALAHDLTAAEADAVKADADQAGAGYEPVPPSTIFITAADYDQRSTNYGSAANNIPIVKSMWLNRMARDWARVNVMVGNLEVKQTMKNGGQPWKESANRLLPNPVSKGWGSDYLALDGTMRSRHVVNDALVDLWGTALVYLCPVQPGSVGYHVDGSGPSIIDPAWFGFGPRSRRVATTVLDSDLRDSATTRFVYQAEIWSCGSDRATSSRRLDPACRDNIPAVTDYQRDLR